MRASIIVCTRNRADSIGEMFDALSKLEPGGTEIVVVDTGIAMALIVAAFFFTFRSGLNKRFANASLTVPMIVAAMLVMAYVLYNASHARGIFMLLYLLPFLFGVFSLTTGAMLGLAVLFGTAAALVVVPWTLRNFLEFHVLIPVSTNGGWNLYMANSPITTPTSGAIAEEVLPLCRRVLPDMTVYQLDGALGRCAVDWVVENPGAAARLYLGKLLNYFNFRNQLATKSEASTWGDWLVFASYYPLLLLALLRVAMHRAARLNRAEVLIIVLYFVNAFVSAIYFTRIRFRIPFDFLLIAVEAAFLVQCWDRLADKRWNPWRR